MKGERIGFDEQLRRWVAGESVHRDVPGVQGGECTPDFSCCKPDLQQPLEVRQAFAAADDRGRRPWLMTFLGALIAKHARRRVHIAGRTED